MGTLRLLGRLLGPLLGHRARYRAPAADGVRLAGSIASTVYLDDRAGVARKVYRASRPVQVLYWAAFQAPFPYGTRESALQTAAAVRELTGLLTRYWTGDDLVSRVTAIRFRENAGPSGLSQQGGGRWELESELVPGEEPRDNAEVAEELRFLRRRFAQAGLPTWQIDIENPHAHTNLIRRPDGRLRIIDLESTLVPLIQPIGRWPQMLRSGRAPLFDDLDYGRLRSYVAAERKGLAATLGADVLRLDAAIDAAEAWSREWKDAEPAIWGRLAGRLWRQPSPDRRRAPVRRRLAQAESLATAFVETALDRWLAEGRIPASEAAATRDRLREEGTRTGMRHLGMAVAVSVPLRFPLGSLTRCAMVLSFRRRARSAYQAGEIDEASYRSARETHTRLVALVALIPGLGAGAYLLSAPLRRSGNLAPLLLDQTLWHAPFGLYARLGLGTLVPTRVPALGPAFGPATRGARTMGAFFRHFGTHRLRLADVAVESPGGRRRLRWSPFPPAPTPLRAERDGRAGAGLAAGAIDRDFAA